jgi:hypothetical protein
LVGGRRVDLRTAQELSPYFREEVGRTAEVQFAAEDRTRILHMIEAAETACDFVSGRTRDDLNRNRALSGLP